MPKRPDGARDEFAGPESGPEHPYPIKLSGPVIRGFGRGSKDLGIPTANIPPSNLDRYPDLPTGIYFGYTSLLLPASHVTSTSVTTQATAPSTSSKPITEQLTANGTGGSSRIAKIFPSVLSIGYNPFYKNTKRSIEIHVLHQFASDFYGSPLNLLMLGYIRPEYDYAGVEALVEDIRTDCEVAMRSLERKAWRLSGGEWKEWLEDFGWAEGLAGEDIQRVEREVLGADADAKDETAKV